MTMTGRENGHRARTDDRTPPNDLLAEEALIGAALLRPDVWDEVSYTVVVSDFYKPAHQFVWEAIDTLHRQHQPVDVVTVAARLDQMGHLDTVGGAANLLALQAGVPRVSNMASYATAVQRAARGRDLIALGARIAEHGFDQGADPVEMFDDARREVQTLERNFITSHVRTTTPLVSDLMHIPWEPPDWVWPGMLVKGHRLIVVGRAGEGKSTFIRQGALYAAAGFHPFLSGSMMKLHPAPQRTSLIVDLENDEQAWRSECRRMIDFLRLKSGIEHLPVSIHALGGKPYDPVRSRADKADLMARINECKPDLLVFGPIYKLDQLQSDQGWHQGAGGIQALLDEVRGTFGCAIVLEAHLGKSGTGPRGAADWEYWPEIGKRLSRPRRGSETDTKVYDFRPARFRDYYQWWPTKITQHTGQMPLRTIEWPPDTFPAGTDLPHWDLPPDWLPPGHDDEAAMAHAGEDF